MANSDNVVRAGLTPKLRDISTLNSCLTYNAAEPSEHTVNPSTYPANWKPSRSSPTPTTVIYNPPIPEFSVLLTRLSPPASGTDVSSTVTTELSGPSMCIVTQGKGWIKWGEEGEAEELKVGEGDVIFVGAHVETTFGVEKSETDGGEGREMNVFRAFVEVYDGEVQ
jgi:mannose-6-phosphate isomerase